MTRTGAPVVLCALQESRVQFFTPHSNSLYSLLLELEFQQRESYLNLIVSGSFLLRVATFPHSIPHSP